MNLDRQSYAATMIFGVAGILLTLVFALVPQGKLHEPWPSFTYQQIGCFFTLAVTFIAIIWVTQTGARPHKGRLRIICWQQYLPVIKNISHHLRKTKGIVLIATTYLGDGIFKELGATSKPIDLIIFDIEALPDLLDPTRVPLTISKEPIPADRRLAAYEDIFGLSFAQPITEMVFAPFLAVHQSKTYGYPLRFGMNALSFSNIHINSDLLFSYAPMLDETNDLHKSLVAHRKIGMVDWYLPTMGTLSVAIGHSKPFNLSEPEFTHLKTVMKNLRPGIHRFYSEPGPLMHDLDVGTIWVVPGGGEWHIPVRKNKRYFKSLAAIIEDTILPDRFWESLAELSSHIDWVIPTEGGLYWVECLGVVQEFAGHEKREPDVTPDALRHILTAAFLDISQQQVFTRLTFSRANTVVKDAILKFPPGQKKLLRTYTNDNISYRADRLIKRQYPPSTGDLSPGDTTVPREKWITFWEEEFKPSRFSP